MKNILLLCFLCFASAVSAQTRLNSATPKLFIENKGQITDKNGLPQPDIHFVLKDRHGNVFIGPQGIHYLFSKTDYSSIKQDKDSVIISTYRMQMHLTGTNPMCQLIRGNKNDYYENYYNVIGRPEGIPHVPTFEKITYKNIYPNIDWELYIVNEQLKYNFIIHPGGDVKNISIEYLNASDARINSDGSLTVTNPLGEINESAPVSWMGKNKTPLQHIYKLVKKENRYEVEFTDTENGSSVYDAKADITIDPLIRWTSYYGGSLEDVLYAPKTDEYDNVYFGGTTTSTNGIASSSSWKDTLTGYRDAFLFKLSTNGTRLWGTYYGGYYNDGITAIDIRNNIMVVAGTTSSPNNIATPNTHIPNNPYALLMAFVAQFNFDGIRVWGSYYGINPTGIKGITLDRFENIYFLGTANNRTSSTYTGAVSGYFVHQNVNSNPNGTSLFLARFNSQGQRLWGTYYGHYVTPNSSVVGAENAIGTDWDGNVYLCGTTELNDSSIYCQNAYKNSKSGGMWSQDGFVAKFKPNGQRAWGTYLGGNNEEHLHSLTVDRDANVYVAGGTNSSGMNSNGWSSTGLGLITRFDSSGNHIWTSYAASPVISMNGDSKNNIVFTTDRTSVVFYADTNKYVGRFNANAQLLSQHYLYEDFRLYNSTIDGSGNIFYCGKTSHPSLNMTGSHQNSYGGGVSDGYIAKMWYDSSFRFTRPLLTKYKWCKGDSVWVKFNINLPFNSGNTMIVQLSNAPGILSSPVTVGTKNITGTAGADSIRIFLPANLTSDSNYRVRIINSNPVDTSLYSPPFFVGQHTPSTLTLQNGFSTEICQNNYSQLLGTPQTGLLKYRWQRNGINLTAADTLRLYRAYTPGTYRVVVTTDAGCITTSIDTVVIVYPNPVSDIRINSTTQQCLTGNLFLFADSSKISAGSITTRKWTWTDSVSAFSIDTQRVFNTHGAYGVSLLVTSDKGCSHSSNKSVEVFVMPSTKIYTTNTLNQCMKGHGFSFTDSSSVAAGSYTRLWDFGDATTDTAVQKSKSYAAAGNYFVKLNITSDKGCKDSANTSVTVHPQPVAGCAVNATEQCLKGNVFNLYDSSSVSTGNINTRSWTLGDATTSTLQSINKTYAFSASYPVTLVVTSDKGCKDSTGKILRVNPHPLTSFTINNTTQCLNGNAFTFTNSSFLPGGSIQGYQWQFGNGDSSNAISPAYQYTGSGNYTVQLVSTSSKNCKDTLMKNVRVHPHPAKPVISRNLFVLSSSTAPSYQWLLNNNLISGATTKDYSVTANGYYQVVVTDTTTCSSRSDSVAVLNVGTKELLSENIHLYPNPNNGTFILELPKSNESYRIEIFNTNGQLVYAVVTDSNVVTPDKQLSKGVYLLRIIHAHELHVVKVVVE